jgi:putative transposase
VRDEALKQHIRRVHVANDGLCGARKVWLILNNEGIAVARCTVERLMAELALTGTPRRQGKRAANTAPGSACPAGPGRQRSGPSAPDQRWVVGLTRLSTCSGFAFAALVTDAYALRILGWRVDTTSDTSIVFDAIEQAISTRQAHGTLDVKNVVHHTDKRSHYTSIRFAEHLATSGVRHLVGAIGNSSDNTVAATVTGLYGTGVAERDKPWRTLADLELATARWVDWFNHRRPSEYCGGIPPAEFEAAYHAGHRNPVDSGHDPKMNSGNVLHRSTGTPVGRRPGLPT